MQIPAFDTQFALVDRVGLERQGFEQLAVQHFE